MRRTPRTAKPSLFESNLLLYGLAGAFAVALLVTASLTFIVVRDTIAGWSAAPGQPQTSFIPPTPEAPALDIPSDEPLQAPGGPQAEPWDGSSRFNLLLVGLDYRDGEEGPSRTDTMILLTIDPGSKTGGMLSIPRDLYVNIPGFNYGKINTAYYLGEAYQVPGGGPALAMETVENFLGVTVNAYAQVDFGAFVRFIDELQGIKVEVPEEITIDLLGDGVDTIKTLQPGTHVLPGEWALAYARARNTAGSDFDRAQRQQQVILAVRNRILDWDMLPVLIGKIPALYKEISEGVHTNLTLDQIIRLAWLAIDLPPENIRRGAIGPDQVVSDFSPDGMSILRPLPDEIRLVRDQVFSTEGSFEPTAIQTSGNPVELAQAEQARISIQNGTYESGLGSRTASFLEDNGLNIVGVDNATQAYPFTTLIDYSGNPYTLAYLSQLMNIAPEHILSSFDPDNPSDVIVLLGEDWVANNPLP